MNNRDITIIDTIGKILQRVIYNRLPPILEYRDGSDNFIVVQKQPKDVEV